MAGPFIGRALLRLMGTAVKSARLAHLRKYQQSFNAINIPPKKPEGISKHAITAMFSCGKEEKKMFTSTQLFANADFDNVTPFSNKSLDSFAQLTRTSGCRQKENTAAAGDIFKRLSARKWKHRSIYRPLSIPYRSPFEALKRFNLCENNNSLSVKLLKAQTQSKWNSETWQTWLGKKCGKHLYWCRDDMTPESVTRTWASHRI